MGKARGYRRDTFATLAYGLPAATALLEANPSSTLSDCSAHFPCILFSFLVPSFLRVSLRQAGISLAVAMHSPYRRVRPKQFLHRPRRALLQNLLPLFLLQQLFSHRSFAEIQQSRQHRRHPRRLRPRNQPRLQTYAWVLLIFHLLCVLVRPLRCAGR